MLKCPCFSVVLFSIFTALMRNHTTVQRKWESSPPSDEAQLVGVSHQQIAPPAFLLFLKCMSRLPSAKRSISIFRLGRELQSFSGRLVDLWHLGSHGLPRIISDFFVWKNVPTKKHIFNSWQGFEVQPVSSECNSNSGTPCYSNLLFGTLSHLRIDLPFLKSTDKRTTD